jgi:hypothetical protein
MKKLAPAAGQQPHFLAQLERLYFPAFDCRRDRARSGLDTRYKAEVILRVAIDEADLGPG